jgi:hypothetical protein
MCKYANMPDADTWVQARFPNLRGGGYNVTSEDTCGYNCIAWAADDTDNWWWPSIDSYWPNDALDDTIDVFELAFMDELGYEPCRSGELEPGYEKVAIYAIGGRTKHMARQLENGTWTSKLGEGWDIEHFTLEGVETNDYGKVVKFMRRPKRS